jgi:hypothetical protein
VNAALLFLGSTWVAGADPPPTPPATPPPAPVIVNGGGSWGGPHVTGFGDGCPCDECRGRVSLHDRLKARFLGRKHRDGDCNDPCATAAQVYAPAPVFQGYTTPPCHDPCSSKSGLLTRLRGRLGGHKSGGGDACDPCWGSAGSVASGTWAGWPGPAGGCATPLPPGAPPGTGPPASPDPPKEMPRPKDPPKPGDGSGPGALAVPPPPLTPVPGPRLTGTTNPY